MVEIVSAKLISHILVDFTSESDMELNMNKFEKMADDFYKSLRKIIFWGKNGAKLFYVGWCRYSQYWRV